jgi:hypothetical protein
LADPVLVVHGVGNRDHLGFERSVADLNQRTGSAWRFVPVFWGDLGAEILGLEDTIPHPRSLAIRRGGAPAPPQALAASLLAGTPQDTFTRSPAESWQTVADAAVRAASGRGLVPVRGGPEANAIRVACAEEWPQTRVLQALDNPVLLDEIGRAIAEGLPDESAPGVAIRGAGEILKAHVKGLVRGIDRAVGAVVGVVAGNLNQFLRTELAPGIGRFLGDILVYQRRHHDIHRRLWEVVDREAPGWGTVQRPIAVVAHSLGGVVSFDAAIGVASRQLWLRHLVTFGSQSAFFHVLDPRGGKLLAYQPGTPVELPPSIAGWTNLWEPLDPLAFLAGKVFLLHPALAGRAPTDIEVPHRGSAGLWAHSVYWKEPDLVGAIRDALS